MDTSPDHEVRITKNPTKDEIREPRIYVPKASSTWRRGDSESANTVSREREQKRYQIDNPHAPKEERARSNSINRIVYPTWWCADDDQEGEQKTAKPIKRLRSADPAKARINKYVARHTEDSLDKRLRAVQEEFKYAESDLANQRRQQKDVSYAYTKQSDCAPVRQAHPGHSNIPMSYSSAPKQSEI